MQSSLYNKLTKLYLSGFRQALEQQQQQSHLYADLGFEERLELLLDDELLQRQQRKIERLEQQAHFRLPARMEQIEYRAQRGFTQAQIRDLQQGNWLTRPQNILLTGATGCGKSYIACALGRDLCRKGVSVRYYRLKTLLETMRLAQADGSYPKLLQQLTRTQLLILDDWGMESIDTVGRSNLLDMIDARYGQSPLIIASQLPVDSWYQIIGESSFADAILDRLIHRAVRLELSGESMRKEKADLTKDNEIE